MMRFDRFTERAQEAAQRAAEIIQRYGHNQIDTEHILLALIEQPQGVIPQILETLKVDSNALNERSTPAARLLEGAGVTRERVYEAVQQIRGGQRVTDPQAETRYRTLEKYSHDLTQMAREGKLDPAIGP